MTATFAVPVGPAPSLDIGRPIRLGALALGLLVVVLGGWAATTVIGGAVIAPGQIVVDGRAKLVQHLDGGTIESLAVRNGDAVAEGDVLLTLDPTLVSLNLDIARTRLAAALALRARLRAERAEAARVDFGVSLAMPAAVSIAELDFDEETAGQREIFAARAAVRAGARARLVETLTQFDEQIVGAQAQRIALSEQLALLEADIGRQTSLVSQGLARQSVLSELQRSQADLIGRRAALEADIARLITAKRDAEIETLQAERAFREEVVTALREVTGQIEELILEIVTRQGELDRMVVRAPADGVVHELQVTTVGGVVAPGATLLEIVPQAEEMMFEVRVEPAAIDQVHAGQEAEIVLSGFDRQTTPHLTGAIRTVSAAAVADPQTGRPFYRVEITVPGSELVQAGAPALLPGMPIEAYLATGDRTVLSYLAAPLTTHMARAFRE